MSNQAPSSKTSFAGLALCALLAATLAEPALAQNAADAGRSVWETVVSVLYGWPGLLIGLVILIVAVFMWLREGFLTALGVAGVGAMLFFTPAIVNWMQTEGAKTSPTAVAPRK